MVSYITGYKKLTMYKLFFLGVSEQGKIILIYLFLASYLLLLRDYSGLRYHRCSINF